MQAYKIITTIIIAIVRLYPHSADTIANTKIMCHTPMVYDLRAIATTSMRFVYSRFNRFAILRADLYP